MTHGSSLALQCLGIVGAGGKNQYHGDFTHLMQISQEQEHSGTTGKA